MIGNTVMWSVTFLLANWTVARLRHKDLAIRLLHESLAAVDPLRVGRHTGRTLSDSFVVGEVIGAGGMGEVYRGHHRRTQRPLAIKMLHPHLVRDSTVLSRFQREAEITGRLGSQHIVAVLDVGQDDGQPFMVLEFLEGENLSELVSRRGRLPAAEVAALIDQAAAGLGVAHLAGVVHRDLKPENLFLSPSPSGGTLLKILDFGLSKIVGQAAELTQEVALLGTPSFMSPEQARGLMRELDGRTDVFALGGITYFALTGRDPFTAESIPALLLQICEEESLPVGELVPDLPAGVGDVLALAKRRGERYATANEFAEDLRAAIEGRLDPRVSARAHARHAGRPARARGDGGIGLWKPGVASAPNKIGEVPTSARMADAQVSGVGPACAPLRDRRSLTRVRKSLALQEMITSKLTSKAQTTIPQPVRAALRLKAGDEIA